MLVATALLSFLGLALVRLLRTGPPSVEVKSPRESAAACLEPDAYRVVPRDRGVELVTLLRDCVIRGVPCRAGTSVSFHSSGALWEATLAHDADVHQLPLRGGTSVTLRSNGRLRSFTLRRAALVDGVLCAAGEVSLDEDARVESALLAEDTLIGDITCRKGTRVYMHHAWRGRRVFDSGIPTHDVRLWDRCLAAGHLVSMEMEIGTLAHDTVIAGVVVGAGAEVKRCPGEERYRDTTLDAFLSERGGHAFGHDLPPRGHVRFHREHDPSPLTAWLGCAWSPVVCAVDAPHPWHLGPVAVTARQCVHYRNNGHAETTLRGDHAVDGVVYPKASRLTVDPRGNIIRWETGRRRHPSRHRGPYRTPGEPAEG